MRITDYDTVAYGAGNKEKKEVCELTDLLDSAIEIIEIKCNLADNMVASKNDAEILYTACESLWYFIKGM